MPRRRTPALAVGAAALAVAVAGCASRPKPTAAQTTPTQTTTTQSPASTAPVTPVAPPPLKLGQIGARTQIPWSAVGVGWSLALTTTKTHPHLVLVDDAGGVYDIATLHIGPNWAIVDRSRDGRRALLEAPYDATAKAPPTAAIEVDLHTGAVRPFTLPAGISALGYTKPAGRAILASTVPSADGPAAVERLDLNGRPQQVLDRDALPGALMTTDGSAVVLNHVIDQAHAQLRLVGNTGRVIRALPMPAHTDTCVPVRWWSTDRVLVHCSTPGSGEDRLWLIPIDGNGAPVAESHQRNDKGPDNGDVDAWRLRAGTTYFTALGACGGVIIAKETSRGDAVQVFVPHQPDRNEILGVDAGDRLLVESSREGGDGGCAEPDTFVWFDPVANHTTPFATRLPGGGHVADVSMWASADDVS